jgi:hypothetical protein
LEEEKVISNFMKRIKIVFFALLVPLFISMLRRRSDPERKYLSRYVCIGKILQ